MASDEVIDSDPREGILHQYFDFGDGLIMPDKPFDVKKEINDFPNETEFGFGSVCEDSSDFFMGTATPSPSSSSTTSSAPASSSSSCNAKTSNREKSTNMNLAMAIADDFMNVDFGSAAADVDIGDFDADLDFLTSVVDIDPVQQPEKSKHDKQRKSSFVARRDNVVIFIDLNSPLMEIRSQLEQRFSFNLSNYGIWLQDSTMLNDRSTLSEQCTEGQGVVKVKLNIQPINDDGYKKINILDVLKVDPEEQLQQMDDYRSSEDDDFFDDDDDDVDVESSTNVTTVAPSQESSPSLPNFVESVEFSRMSKRFNYPLDISRWSRLHTLQWAKWVNRTFKGVCLNEEHWSIDGPELASLTEDEFTLMVGFDPSNYLWSHFSLLRETGVATVPGHYVSELTNIRATAAVANLNNRSTLSSKRTLDQYQQHPAAPKKQRVILGKYEEAKIFINSEDSSSGHRSGNNGNNVQLWKFLLDILTDYKHRDIIRWSLGDGSLEGEFVMCEPEGVARLWGQQKGKVTMNYEKLSRALRYYKGGSILDKVANKKFTYRFVCDLRDIVGFSASELDRKVREQIEAAEVSSSERFS